MTIVTSGVHDRPVRQMLDNSVFGRKPMEIGVRDIVEPTAEYLVRRLADRVRRGAQAEIGMQGLSSVIPVPCPSA